MTNRKLEILELKRKHTHNNMLDAEVFGSRALSKANELRESGNTAKAEQYYDRAQYWLDRSNTYRDLIIELDMKISELKRKMEC